MTIKERSKNEWTEKSLGELSLKGYNVAGARRIIRDELPNCIEELLVKNPEGKGLIFFDGPIRCNISGESGNEMASLIAKPDLVMGNEYFGRSLLLYSQQDQDVGHRSSVYIPLIRPLTYATIDLNLSGDILDMYINSFKGEHNKEPVRVLPKSTDTGLMVPHSEKNHPATYHNHINLIHNGDRVIYLPEADVPSLVDKISI